MWAFLVEWCADVVATPTRSRTRFAVTVGLFFVLSSPPLMRWGWRGLLPLALLAAVGFVVARDLNEARALVERAALLSLNDPNQRPPELHNVPRLSPTVTALHYLAVAIDAARRGQYREAHDLVPRIERVRLRPWELQLLDATGAIISIGLGDNHRAARQAILALPTGSDDLDASLGRAILAAAWTNPARLRVIELVWHKAGVDLDGRTTLTRLRRLVRIRTGQQDLDQLTSEEARALSEDARALGDEELAADLTLQARHLRSYR